jgi:hypothetical protein
MIIRVIFYAVMHYLVFIFTVYVRSFQSVKDNIIEVINDFSYAAITWTLIFLNRKGGLE